MEDEKKKGGGIRTRIPTYRRVTGCQTDSQKGSLKKKRSEKTGAYKSIFSVLVVVIELARNNPTFSQKTQ